MPTNAKKISGFTLLEVLVALVMIATAFTAIYLSLSTATRNLIALHDKTAATWVGLNVITETQLGLTSGNQSNGITNMFDTNWQWRLSTSSTPNANVSMLSVAVSKKGDSNAIVHLTGYLLNKNTP